MAIKKQLYKLYRRVEHNRFFSSLAKVLYLYIFPLFTRWFYKKNFEVMSNPQGVRIAFICDEMTFKCFAPECTAVFVTPSNWKRVLKRFDPQLLFCESAWSGIDDYKDCWRGRIYRNKNNIFETRGSLLHILKDCKQNKIPTVFWNKEDPTFFGNLDYDFVDTALRFDFIFTTAEECVERYQKLGHQKVNTMMFSVQPRLFQPLKPVEREWDTAVFAGSWYADQPDRCKDCCAIFDMVLEQNLKLVIYDRGYYSSDQNRRFPQQYRPYIHPPIPYEQLSRVAAKAGYAININTVCDSETMFARRVFEWMACDVMIISNHSCGMEKLFPDTVWYIDKTFDKNLIKQSIEKNKEYVLAHHTAHKALQRLLRVCGIR